jgi:hypothetical protein
MLTMISFGSSFMDSHGLLHYKNTFNGKRNSGVVGCCVLSVTYIVLDGSSLGVVVPISFTLFLDPINTIRMTYVQHKIIHKRF